MSIVSGLVERHTEHQVLPQRANLAEWTIRNAWSVVLGASLAFWLVFALVLLT